MVGDGFRGVRRSVLERGNSQTRYEKVCVWVRICMFCVCMTGKIPVMSCMYCGGEGRDKNELGCVYMGADGYRRVHKHAGTRISHTELDIVPKPHI